ncbi:MAG: hypothetical protein QM648_01880 [Solirubrobacterales bacterium]
MPEGLLAPRLYRAAFAPALFALIVLAFSLQDPGRSIAPELSPPGFSSAQATTFATQAVENYGARVSGSEADFHLSTLVAARLQDVGFRVSQPSFDAATLSGNRKLINVIGVRPGPSDRRLLVIASRDGAPGKLRSAGALETGILMELARVLEGRTFDHTLVLASVSGGIDGGLGARQLIQTLRGPFDAVLVIRNAGSKLVSAPVLLAGDSRMVPDERYVRTVRRIAGVEFRRSGDDQRRSVPEQLVRLGFPVALGEQATFASSGVSGVSLSPGGEPLGAPGTASRQQTGQIGQIALRTLTTMDDSIHPEPPSASPLRVGGKLIPQWALVLLIGSLFFPLIVASIDAWARARRWHQSGQRGLIAPAIAAVWLLVIGFLLRGVGISGIIHAPPLAPDPAAVTGWGATAVGILALVLAVLGVLVAAGAARQATPKGGEAAFALWVVFTGLIVFVVNPVAAGFLLLLLHLVVLMLLTAGSPRRRQIAGLTLLGLTPLIAVALYYPAAFGIAFGGVLRYAVLLTAGGFIGPLGLAAGCAAAAALGTALIHLWWSAPREPKDAARRPVTQPF